MIDRLQHQLEIRGETAILYLAGALQLGDLAEIAHLCDGLPPQVTLLRVDLHALVAPAPDSVSAVRAVLHEWRDRRRGAFRLTLCTSHLVATYREHEPVFPPARFTVGAGASPDALMATFL